MIKTINPAYSNKNALPQHEYIRNALGYPISTSDGNGYCIKKEFTIKGKPTLIIFPDGTTEKHRYTLWGALSETVERNGTRICYSYDLLGRETKKEWFDVAGCLLKTTSKEYNAFHLISETDGNGVKTIFTYDIAGRLSMKKTENIVESYSYDTMGRESRVTISSEEGVVISHVKLYDHLDRVIEQYPENPDGTIINKVVKRFDANGNEVESHVWNQAGQATTTTQYDAFGRVICVTNALGESTHTTYSENGLRVEVTNPLGVKKVTLNNAYGNPLLEQCYNPMGQLIEEIAYEYDKNGNKILRKIKTDSTPIKTIWHYDSLNQLIRTIEAVNTPDQKQIQRQYDLMGNLKILTKNDGVQLHYTYDALGRNTSLNSTDVSYTYTYDSNDNLLSAKDEISDLTTTRGYDAHNRLISETLFYGQTMSYRYDSLGNVKTMTLPDNTKAHYDYKGDTLLAIRREGTLNYSHIYKEYDTSSNPIHIQLAADAGEIKINYDQLSRPLHISAPHFSESFGYHAHLLKQRTSQDPFGKAQSSFTYDAKDQLLFENGPSENAFEYDWQGNPIFYNGQKRTFNACNALLKDNTQQYEYDLNGNRITDFGINMLEFNEKINNSENGFFISWMCLKELASLFWEIIDIILLGSKDINDLHRYEDDEMMYRSCDFVIVLFDSSFWEVFSKDANFIMTLSKKFNDVIPLPPDFQKGI